MKVLEMFYMIWYATVTQFIFSKDEISFLSHRVGERLHENKLLQLHLPFIMRTEYFTRTPPSSLEFGSGSLFYSFSHYNFYELSSKTLTVRKKFVDFFVTFYVGREVSRSNRGRKKISVYQVFVLFKKITIFHLNVNITSKKRKRVGECLNLR